MGCLEARFSRQFVAHEGQRLMKCAVGFLERNESLKRVRIILTALIHFQSMES